MKIATWNVNSIRVRLPHVLDWLDRESPDLLALQETKVADDRFPADAFREAGYQAVVSGQKTYNGVAILARHPAADILVDLPGLESPERRLVAATYGPLRLFSVYVPNGKFVGSESYEYKLEWLRQLRELLLRERKRHPWLAVVGDLNVAPEDRDVHDPEAWRDQILCSRPEREAFRELTGAGFVDVFRMFTDGAGAFSWWDYRMGAFRRNRGLRIDHVLVTRSLAERCRGCRIDREPRGLERPSDHAPVVAEFDVSEE